MQYFALNGVNAAIVPLPTMEANKDFELVFELARQMEHFKLNRWASAGREWPALPKVQRQRCSHVHCALDAGCVPRVGLLTSSKQCTWLCRRKEPIIAIGGGVCLDVCGLAANLYRRNTPVIKVLTQPVHTPALSGCGRSFVYDNSAVSQTTVQSFIFASPLQCTFSWLSSCMNCLIAEVAMSVMSHGCHMTGVHAGAHHTDGCDRCFHWNQDCCQF